MSRSKTNPGATLSGWWKGLPLLMLPFSVLFSEAWMRTQILSSHYEANELSEQIRALEARVEALHDDQVNLIRLDRIDEKAPDLGLVEPQPGQIVLLRSSVKEDKRPQVAKMESLPRVDAPPAFLPEQREVRSAAIVRDGEVPELELLEPLEPVVGGR